MNIDLNLKELTPAIALVTGLGTALGNLVIALIRQYTRTKKVDIANIEFISSEHTRHVEEAHDSYLANVMRHNQRQFNQLINRSVFLVSRLIKSKFHLSADLFNGVMSDYRFRLENAFDELQDVLRARADKNGFLTEDEFVFSDEVHKKGRDDYEFIINKLIQGKPLVMNYVTEQELRDKRKQDFRDIDNLAKSVYYNMRKEYSNFLKKKQRLSADKNRRLYGENIKEES